MTRPPAAQKLPRLCFVGPMVGRHPGHLTAQGLILSELIRATGYPVISTSEKLNRYMRASDIANTLARERHNIDILIIEVYGGPSFVIEDIASWLGRQFGHRIIMWLHGGALPEFMARFPAWTNRVLRRADLLVAPSQFLAKTVTRHGFQAKVIPNVIDLSLYDYRHRRSVEPRLFWMRGFHPIWNPEMAIHTLARLRVEVPEASLVMAGPDKGTRVDVERLAQELGVADGVRFAGFLDAKGKAVEAAAADIYINTNRVDNMPVAVVEAMAFGLPVVTTAVGGIPDLLKHGDTGLFVPVNDQEAMVRAIQSLLKNPELAARLSANGRCLAEQSSWDRVRQPWEELFATLAGRSTAKAREHPLAGSHRELAKALDDGSMETL